MTDGGQVAGSIEPWSSRADGAARASSAVVSALVGGGLVDAGRSEEARRVVQTALTGPATAQAPMRRRLAEVAGYVGGTLVVAAVILFLAEEWAGLTVTAQVVVLAATAAVLFAAAAVMILSGRRGAEEPQTGVRRRLAGALATGAAVAAAAAVAVVIDDISATISAAPWYLFGLTLGLVALAGYRLAPSALGQLAIVFGVAHAVGTGLDAVFTTAPSNARVIGVALLVLGVGQLALAERGVWRERYWGVVLGCALLLAGGQTPALFVLEGGWVGYLLTFAVALGTLVRYLAAPVLPYLVTAIAALTLGVPEALLDWTEGSLGTVGVLLATGLTLLVASLLGLRLHRTVGEESAPGVSAPGAG